MIRLIFLTDFTERFAYNLLKGILAYAKNHEPWVVCRMPPSFKAAYGMEGVLKWAKTWQADAIIGQFGNDDNVDLFRQNGIIALAQDYKERFTNIPNITGDYRKTGQMGAEFFLTKGFPILLSMATAMPSGRRNAARDSGSASPLMVSATTSLPTSMNP